MWLRFARVTAVTSPLRRFDDPLLSQGDRTANDHLSAVIFHQLGAHSTVTCASPPLLVKLMKIDPVGGKPGPYQFIVVRCEWPAAIDPPPELRLTSTRDVEACQVRVPPPVFDTVISSTGENGLLQLVSLMKYELRVS